MILINRKNWGVFSFFFNESYFLDVSLYKSFFFSKRAFPMIHSFSNFSTVVLCLSNASCSFRLVVVVVLLRVNLFFHCNLSEDFIAFIYSIYELTSVYCLVQKIFQQDIVIMGKDREERKGRAWCLELVPFQLKVQVKTSVYVEMMGSSAQGLHCGAKLKAHSQLKSN